MLAVDSDRALLVLWVDAFTNRLHGQEYIALMNLPVE